LDLVKSAELFAKNKHAGQFRKDDTTPYSKHLEDVVNRLKSLGVIDEQVLCAGWLHDTIEDTETSFDDLYEQFGSEIAVNQYNLYPFFVMTAQCSEIRYCYSLVQD
jgi:guanosine-3',5'-bis(diphosphate) 3'-pyrophosphohydrolase